MISYSFVLLKLIVGCQKILKLLCLELKHIINIAFHLPSWDLYILQLFESSIFLILE